MTEYEMLRRGRQIMRMEAEAILRSAYDLGTDFCVAVRVLQSASFIHCAGVGKSGDLAGKMAGMLCSYGIAAASLDPLRAVHGDLGRVRAGHAAVMISRSGECEETVRLAEMLKEREVVILALSSPHSSLARLSRACVDCSVTIEADSWNLAPSASTAAALAAADALCVLVGEVAGFTKESWRRTHPGGPAR